MIVVVCGLMVKNRNSPDSPKILIGGLFVKKILFRGKTEKSKWV
jgi:hypothetical protein